MPRTLLLYTLGTLFHSEIGFTFGWVFIHEEKLFSRRVRKRKITRPVCSVKQKNSSSSMISSIRHKQSISWTFLSDAMAISGKEMPKNHTDKERFAAASSCIVTGILTFLFPRKQKSPLPFLYIMLVIFKLIRLLTQSVQHTAKWHLV